MFPEFFENILKPGSAGIFGVPATYAPISGPDVPDCTVVIDKDAELRPDSLDVGMVEIGITLEGFVSEIGEPYHGSTFTMGDGTAYRVARTDSNDGEYVKLVVNEV